ncbi:MAG: M24 family metallopeptidase, partial [Acidobacteria bacterium]|nr:M24 family metallopeptidase [Acidobacteriota bacterium]
IFNIVREARDAAVAYVQKSLREGKTITGASVDDVSRGVITRAGYGKEFLHRTGHSIGEEVHGNGANIDDLETQDSRTIIPRTCFSIEPGIYLEGKFGVRSEIDVYIVSDREAVVTGQPIQTEIIAILK